MRKLLMILGFVLVSSIVLAQPNLTIVTCNMMGMKPDTQWEERLQMQIDQLSALAPDFILLQEVCETVEGHGQDNMGRTMAAGLSGQTGTEYDFFFSPTDISWGEFQEGIAIVSCHPVLQYGYLDLTPGALKRKVIWVQADAGMGLVNVFCTHLSYRDDHEYIRVKQAEEIHTFIDSINTAYPADAIILGGDFNCIPGSAPYQVVTNGNPNRAFIDCFSTLHPDDDGFTFASDNLVKRCDFIFIPDDGALYPASSEIILNQASSEGFYPSDHLSVLVRFGFE